MALWKQRSLLLPPLWDFLFLMTTVAVKKAVLELLFFEDARKD